MGDDVKGNSRARSRVYDASGRRAKARATRRAVLETARELLEHQGFAATTIDQIARAAGVSPESIYKGFGSKAALVKEVFDVSIAGDDDPVPVAERPEAQAIRQEPDLETKLRLYAQGAAVRAERTARLQLAVRNAAALDPAMEQLWHQLKAERLTGMTLLATHLADSGQLRPGIGVEEVRDVLWTCISVEVYDLLVLQRGWTRTAYAAWLTRTLVASLAED